KDAFFVVRGVAVVVVKDEAGVGLGGDEQIKMPQGVPQDVLDVLAGGKHRRPPQEHGDGPQAHRHFDGLAAGVGAQVVVHVVPGAAGGQVEGAGDGALFHHVGHQNAGAVHKGQVLVAVAGGVVGE